MTELVRQKIQGSVCLIEMNDGRDNRLSRSMCFDLSQQLNAAFENPNISVVVITGTGSFFSTGYDLSALSSDADQTILFQLVDLLVKAPKPVIAAIQGDAFGAGLEIALLCSFRLAAPGVAFGFPDINHGLPPGAGATQTLPRVVGARKAIDLLLRGRSVSGATLGTLLDAEIQGDFITGSMRFAQSLASQKIGPVSIGDRTEGFADPVAFQSAMVDARQQLDGDTPAQADVLNSVETALLLPFSAGIDVERETFKGAEARPEARARRHLVCQMARLKTQVAETMAPPDQLTRIAVIGEGDLAVACVSRLLLAGSVVSVVHGGAQSSEDLRFEILDQARQGFEAVQGGEFHEARMSELLSLSTDLTECAAADLVLDASEDEMEDLKSRAQKMGALLPGHVIFAVASQQLGIAKVADAFARQSQFAKIWLEPDLEQELAVFSLAKDTHSGSRQTVLALLNRLGFPGLENKYEAGMVSIFMWLTLLQASETICLSGTPVSAIDTALAEIGFGDGPFRMADQVGIEAVSELCADVPAFRGELSITRGLLNERPSTGDSLVTFYLQEDGREGVPNPDATRVIQSLRPDRGKKLDALEIQHYCLAVLANEAAQLLADEALHCPGDLDLMLTEEFGLSSELGGPLHAADSAGLLHLRYLLTGQDGRAETRDALLDLIKNGLNFNALNAEVQRLS